MPGMDILATLPEWAPERPARWFTWREALTTSRRELLQTWPLGEYGRACALNAVRLGAVLDLLRERNRGPLDVTSWLRPPDLNAAVGGRPKSAHLLGCGVDLAVAEDDPLVAYTFYLQHHGALVEALWHKLHLHIAVSPIATFAWGGAG